MAGDYWLGVCVERTQTDYFVTPPTGGNNREDAMDGWVYGPLNPWRHATDTRTTRGDMLVQIVFP